MSRYKLRNLPCNIAPNEQIWCIVGHKLGGMFGVLEWCYDETDANQVLKEISRDKRYVNLQARPYLVNGKEFDIFEYSESFPELFKTRGGFHGN